MRATADMPRYLAIQHDLQEQIISGAWHPGHRIPPEHELQQTYGCSRMTVNKALSALASAGLIVRKRKSGSAVAMPTAQQSVLEIPDIKAEVLATGKSYRFEVLERELRNATVKDAERLDVVTSTMVLSLQVRHFAADLPYVLERRLINCTVVPAAREELFEASPPGTWLLDLIPWTTAEHIIRAEAASARTAKRLGIDKRDACLIIERRTRQVDQTVTWVRLSYPGARHQLVSRFSPNRAFLPGRG